MHIVWGRFDGSVSVGEQLCYCSVVFESPKTKKPRHGLDGRASDIAVTEGLYRFRWSKSRFGFSPMFVVEQLEHATSA